MTPTFRHAVETSKPSPHPPSMQRLPSRQIVAPGGSVSPVKTAGMGSLIAGSPLKQVSYRSNIVSTGQPVLLPMTMINGALASKDAAAVGTSSAPIRDTKVVKKKRAELPSQRNLPHPTPKFGDWLNSRTMIDNYIILEPLGSGSYADVKLCKEKMSGKLFAMKFINRDIMKKDKLGKQSKLDDIKREIAIMKKLNHPNVLRLYEVMDDPNMNKLFLVLEYMEHGDLLSHQKKKHPHSIMESLHDRDLHCVVLQVVLGLAYLHEQKIVHGDIKPQNILVGDHDVVKIADFGISQSLYGSKQKLSDTAGTPAVMSPEMCSGEAYSGQMADIWTVGATIFMLKFGNPPFLAKSAMQMFEKIQNDPLEFPFPIDPLLQDLLTGMVIKDPQQRMTLEDVMMHPWVTKEEYSSHYSTRHAAPRITVSNDEIDHAIDSKDQFAIIVNIRIQMMKNLQKARQEILEKRRAAREDNAAWPIGTTQVSAAGALSEEGVAHEKSLKAKTLLRHKQNKIHADEVKDSHEMLSNEEIEYRAQFFSRKKTGSTAVPTTATTIGGGGKVKDQHGTHGFQGVDKDSDSQDDDESGLLSSDDDDDAMAVAQSPQLLDELLLTTLSMPPLSKTKTVVANPDRSSNHPLQEAPISSSDNGAIIQQVNHLTPVNDPEGFYGQSSALSLQFGVASLQGRRNTQEDRWVVVPSINEAGEAHSWIKSAFVGLYDGHGGEECANILHEQLHSWIFHNPHDLILKSPHSLQSCFEELDSYVCDYLLQKGDLSGSTATCVILSPAPDNTGKVHAIVAHVGDCRLVLSHRNSDVLDATNDHRLTLAEEHDRILQLGGRVVNNRVNGVMAITRAFGDLEFKGMFSRKPDNVNASSTSSMSLHLPSSVQLNPFQKEDEKIPTLLTARPDIHILSLDPAIHEFLLLAARDPFANVVIVPLGATQLEKQGRKKAKMLELHRLLHEFRDAEEKLRVQSAATGSAAFAVIPVFDDASYQLGKYKDGALLKFRGVVVDVQDPELVLMAPEDGEDFSTQEQGLDVFTGAEVRDKFVERIPLKVSLFPHRTEWAQQAYSASGKPVDAKDGRDGAFIARPSTDAKRTKRGNDAVATDVEMTQDDKDDGEVGAHATVVASIVNAKGDDSLSKKPKATPDSTAVDDASQSSLLLPKDLINVYVYDGQYADVSLDAFKVNEAFDFIGVLDLMVLGSALKDTTDASKVVTEQELAQLQISDHLEEREQRQRSGVVVHCCDVGRIDALHHIRPHNPREFYKDLEASSASRRAFCATTWTSHGYEGEIGTMRQRLIDYLAEALSGDVVTAEYLLLCLLSRVYSRADQTTPLGNLSLNITLSTTLNEAQVNAYVEQLETVIHSLVPVATSVDLGLKTLNETKFMPHKDYDNDAMRGGALQVPQGTVLLVKETSLSAGQLNDQGVKNVGALQALVEKMVLPYDFQFYSMEFPQDVAVVSVSEGKSILPVTASIALKPGTTGSPRSRAEVPTGLLESFRVYLGVLRTWSVTIGNEQAEIAEKHYVACRQAQQEVSLDDLHRWLRIARLVALSEGEDVVSRAAWDHMLALERKRQSRA
ncbi:Camkk/camkk-meta protein kinase, partial [Globisporangium splendens]